MRMKTTPPNRIVKTGNSHNVCAPENKKKQLKYVFNSSFKKGFTDSLISMISLFMSKNTIGLEISFRSKSEQTSNFQFLDTKRD